MGGNQSIFSPFGHGKIPSVKGLGSAMVQAYIDFNTPDGQILFTNPNNAPVAHYLRVVRVWYNVTESFTGGAASTIGISSSNGGANTKGDLAGGAAGDAAANLTAGVRGGTVGTKLANNGAVVLAPGDTLRFDRITSAFTTGKGYVFIELAEVGDSLTALSVMPLLTPVTLLTLASRASSGTGASIDLGSARVEAFSLRVTALSGAAPSLAVVLEGSLDEVTWGPILAFPVATVAPTDLAITPAWPSPPAPRYVRASWTLGPDTLSATLSVSASAEIPYASLALFRELAPAAASLEGFAEGELWAALLSASSELDDYLGGRFTLPLLRWSTIALPQHTVNVAAYRLLTKRGWRPQVSEDEQIRLLYEDALRWAKAIASGAIAVVGIVDSTPVEGSGPGAGDAFVVTRPRRGWGRG